MIKRFLAIFSVIALTGCASVDMIPADYAGPDSGKVVVGMGTATGTWDSTYSLMFRKPMTAGATEMKTFGQLTFSRESLGPRHPPDYQSSSESGVVLVQALPAGDYEIYNFNIFSRAGVLNYYFRSKTDISIPFSVKAGQTTYLGNYQANQLIGKNVIGFPEPGGAVFVVTDRLAPELALAQVKSKTALGAPTDATPDPARIGSAYFVKPGGAPVNNRITR